MRPVVRPSAISSGSTPRSAGRLPATRARSDSGVISGFGSGTAAQAIGGAAAIHQALALEGGAARVAERLVTLADRLAPPGFPRSPLECVALRRVPGDAV